MTLREELIQVAAVAVAIVEDLDRGTTEIQPYPFEPYVKQVLTSVAWERSRQEAKWGPQHHTPEEWLAILAEEVGEAAREIPESENGRMEFTLHLLRKAETAARRFLKERFGQ